jgi:hypothetical protein
MLPVFSSKIVRIASEGSVLLTVSDIDLNVLVPKCLSRNGLVVTLVGFVNVDIARGRSMVWMFIEYSPTRSLGSR